jgi:cyclic pyranopterin phosphate synthase
MATKRSLTHVDKKNRPGMVDVSGKVATFRTAMARAVVELPAAVRALLEGDDLRSPKGPVFQTAIIAGTQAVKRTAELIPFCHPLPIEACRIAIALNARGHAEITCAVSLHHKTGVEMEALTGATVAALTVYDMCKGVSHDMVIREVSLIEKTGGKTDVHR